MKILVIDDSVLNLEVAKAQLVGHDVTVTATYDEAQGQVGEAHGFDVVLCDLLMPPSSQMLPLDVALQFTGKELPVGVFLAILAAKNGARFVGLLTDASHHEHPASACIDPFGDGWDMDAFTIGNAKVMFSNNQYSVQRYCRDDLSKTVEWEEYSKNKEACVTAKDWRGFLEYLIQ